MYFRIIAENVSHKIFNLAQNESIYRGTILRAIKYVGNKSIIHCLCENHNELYRIISTLETENEAFVSLVESSLGERIPLKGKPLMTAPNYNGHTLKLAS